VRVKSKEADVQLEMSLRPTMQLCQLMLAEVCDFGIEPVDSSVSVRKDLVVVGSKVVPCLVFSRCGCERTILFNDGYGVPWLTASGAPNAREHWQENAAVYFAQEEPTDTEVTIFVLYRGTQLAQTVRSEDLAFFLDFVFQDGETGEFDEDDEDFYGLDYDAQRAA
jgi:hypothetical protein